MHSFASWENFSFLLKLCCAKGISYYYFYIVCFLFCRHFVGNLCALFSFCNKFSIRENKHNIENFTFCKLQFISLGALAFSQPNSYLYNFGINFFPFFFFTFAFTKIEVLRILCFFIIIFFCSTVFLSLFLSSFTCPNSISTCLACGKREARLFFRCESYEHLTLS